MAIATAPLAANQAEFEFECGPHPAWWIIKDTEVLE